MNLRAVMSILILGELYQLLNLDIRELIELPVLLKTVP